VSLEASRSTLTPPSSDPANSINEKDSEVVSSDDVQDAKNEKSEAHEQQCVKTRSGRRIRFNEKIDYRYF